MLTGAFGQGRRAREDRRSGSAGRCLSAGFGPVFGREVGDERAQVEPVWELPVELGQQVGIEEEVEVGDDREVRLGEQLMWAGVRLRSPTAGSAGMPARIARSESNSGQYPQRGRTPYRKRSRPPNVLR